MSLIKETITIKGRTLYKTSHNEFKIRKKGTDEIYHEAIDVEPTEYEITDIEKELKKEE